MLRSRIAPVAVVAALAATAALASPAAASRDAVTIKVIATDLKFTVPLKFAPAGRVTFLVINKGHLPHDFKIAGKKTPLIQPGRSFSLKVTLKKGKYPYLCTVPGHAAAGMKGVFTAR